MSDGISEFLQRFLSPNNQSQLEERAKKVAHWIGVMQDPARANPAASVHELRTISKNARQNARRLLKKYPEVKRHVERIMAGEAQS